MEEWRKGALHHTDRQRWCDGWRKGAIHLPLHHTDGQKWCDGWWCGGIIKGAHHTDGHTVDDVMGGAVKEGPPPPQLWT